MERFLKRAEVLFPDRIAALRRDADDIDGNGRCILWEGARFRSHGEEAFRTYESELLSWSVENGHLGEALPDLSASAVLRPENRALFSPARGYCPILLDASQDVLVRNIIADYSKFERARDAGKPITVRGDFERTLDQVQAADAESLKAARVRALRTKLDATAEVRLPVYRKFARAVLPVDLETSIAELTASVIRLAGQ